MKGQILLVEDEQTLNRAVSLKLSREGYEVYGAQNLKQAENIYENRDIRLIICDIGLPDGSGLDFCKKIRASERIAAEGDGVVFLFLTAMDAEEDIVRGYAVGGDDYVTKPFSLAVLISKVNAIMSRYSYTGNVRQDSSVGSGKTIKSGSITMDMDKNRAAKDGEYLSLTKNEQKLLMFFMKNPMKILSKAQLLEAIWDIDGSFVDDNTVAVNIRRLREKIEEDPSSPGIIKNVRGLGYIWERECETL